MTDPLKKLRERMVLVMLSGGLLDVCDTAILAVLDEFRKEYEAKEVVLDDNGLVRRWRDDTHVDPPGCFGGEGTVLTTILIPRKQEPTLLEEVESFRQAVDALALEGTDATNKLTAKWVAVRDADKRLEAALEKERDK